MDGIKLTKSIDFDEFTIVDYNNTNNNNINEKLKNNDNNDINEKLKNNDKNNNNNDKNDKNDNNDINYNENYNVNVNEKLLQKNNNLKIKDIFKYMCKNLKIKSKKCSIQKLNNYFNFKK